MNHDEMKEQLTKLLMESYDKGVADTMQAAMDALEKVTALVAAAELEQGEKQNYIKLEAAYFSGLADGKEVVERQWVGLTAKEINALYVQHHNQFGECISGDWGYERDIEAKLKEKNGG